MELKKTSLYDKHILSGGRLIDFGGWLLPVEYKSMLKEAKVCRANGGIFDASHMGEIIIQGPQALDFLQTLTTNDLERISCGQMQYNLILNENGGVIDDCMVYRRRDDFMCVVNASNKDKVFAWFTAHVLKYEATVTDASDTFALISIQGPHSSEVIERVFGSTVSSLPYMEFLDEARLNRGCIISRSGYTAEDGFEIYSLWNQAPGIWYELHREGAAWGIIPCGLGARDILRIEAGYPLYGHELTETITPHEASLTWAVAKRKEFIGKGALLDAQEKTLSRKRVGFIMQERAFARQGHKIHDRGNSIGCVSSGVFSPNCDAFIGMGFVSQKFSQPGAEVKVHVRDKFYSAKLIALPFVRRKTKRLKQPETNNLKDPAKDRHCLKNHGVSGGYQ